MACIQALKCMNYPQRNVVEMYWILSPSVLSNRIAPISEDIVPFQQTWPCLGTPLLQAWGAGSGELPNPTFGIAFSLEWMRYKYKSCWICLLSTIWNGKPERLVCENKDRPGKISQVYKFRKISWIEHLQYLSDWNLQAPWETDHLFISCSLLYSQVQNDRI